MTNDRKPHVWEVTLQSPDGKSITEKVSAFWSPSFDGIKADIAIAARCKAWLRNKKKVEFKAIGEPTLLGKLGDEGVAA